MNLIRARLRDATAGAHIALEATMDLVAGTLTIERYGRALQMLHAIRAGWEPYLAAYLPGLRTPYIARLANDLGVLQRPMLDPAPSPPIHDQHEAWGLRYVLEGSALGGRVLLQDAARLGVTAERGGTYFAGDGAETGRHWRQFLSDLDDVATAKASSCIVHGAVKSFAALDAYAGSVMQDVPAG